MNVGKKCPKQISTLNKNTFCRVQNNKKVLCKTTKWMLIMKIDQERECISFHLLLFIFERLKKMIRDVIVAIKRAK